MNATQITALALKGCLAAVLAVSASACVLVGPPHGAKAGHDVVVCHKGKKTMTLPREALAAHLDHGDRQGPC